MSVKQKQEGTRYPRMSWVTTSDPSDLVNSERWRDSRFKSQDDSSLDDGDANKGPGPWRVGFIHSFSQLATARGARIESLTLMITASVRLVRAVQRLTSKEGSFCLVAVRFDGPRRFLLRPGIPGRKEQHQRTAFSGRSKFLTLTAGLVRCPRR